MKAANGWNLMDLDISKENIRKEPAQELKYADNIPVIATPITYNKFFEEYLIKNQPCIIKYVSAHWKSAKHWLTHERTNINFDYLRQKYGDSSVLVYNCNKRHFNSHHTQKLSFHEYLDYWQSYKLSQYSKEYPLLYLKDWHLKNSRPGDKFYKVPEYFTSDWLNEYLVEQQKDDYRFVYMGPKGTWTPCHSDVFQSYSWSVNLVGSKRWILLHPGEERKLKDGLGNIPHDIYDLIARCHHYDVTQEAGDAMFVPSGWYHHVANVNDTISINHNWFNGCNIHLVYLDMSKHLEDVKEEIADCKQDSEFVEQCQVVLNASYGMAFREFLNIITCIAVNRMKQSPLKNLHIFDLHRIKNVLELFIEHEDVNRLKLYDEAHSLHEQICDFIA